MKLSRILALFLAAVMLLGAVNTCFAETPALQKVRILAKTGALNDEIGTKDWEKFFNGQQLKQKLADIGLELEIEFIEDANYQNVVRTRMASGVDLPDLISAYEPTDDVRDWAESGLVQELTALLAKYDEDGSILKFYEERVPGAKGSTTLPDGGMYWFSYIANQQQKLEDGTLVPPAEPYPLSIRKDWVEAVGEELKECYTPDELFDLLVKFQEQDVNGNGVKDEVVDIDIASFFNGIAAGFDLNSSRFAYFFNEDSKVFTNWEHESLPAYINFMKKLYENGLYDTAALDSASREAIIASNRAALVSWYSVTGYEKNIIGANTTPLYMPIILDLDGDWENGFTMYEDATMFWIMSYFIPSTSQNAEAVIKLMDFVYSDEFVDFTVFGTEGVNYTWDENGKRVSTDKTSLAPTDYWTLWDMLFCFRALPLVRTYSDDMRNREDYIAYLNANSSYPYIDSSIWKYDYQIKYRNAATHTLYTMKMIAPATTEENERVNALDAELTTYATELLTDLILGRKSLDDMSTYLEDMNKLGLQDYLNIMQARRDRYLGK